MTTKKQKAIAPHAPEDGNRSKQTSLPFYQPSSKQFQRSGKGKPCPICDRTKDADCCWNDEVVLCHTHMDSDAKVSGYVYRGTEDIWGMYFPDTAHKSKPIRPKSNQEFIYRDKEGNALVQVYRVDDGKGKKKIWQSHWNGQKWVKGLTPEIKNELRLYRISDPINQDAIAHQKPILIVEGEGKVDLLLSMKIAATSSIGGEYDLH